MLLSYSFRPFFLGASLWAALGVLLWLPQYFGEFRLPTHLGALDWHVHEMLYGYAPATIAGFLLTAIPNWTGRLPVNGPSLGALVALWLAGRVALLVSASFGPLAAAIDLTFLIALAAVAAVEIVAGKNWRNLRVLLVLSVLIGHAAWHWLTERAERLAQFPLPALDAATVASAMRWLIALIVLGIAMWAVNSLVQKRVIAKGKVSE